jgi:hypothetical protein
MVVQTHAVEVGGQIAHTRYLQAILSQAPETLRKMTGLGSIFFAAENLEDGPSD